MPKKLISLNTHAPFVFAFRMLWSSSWNTRHPWEDYGQHLGYVSFHKQAYGDLMLRIMYFGPLAFIVGTVM